MFSKGDPRINRNGRPKGAKTMKPPTQLLREFGMMQPEEIKRILERGQPTVLQRIAAMTVLSALNPKNHAQRVDMFNRLEGMPVQRIRQNIDEELTVTDESRYRFGDLTETDMLKLRSVVAKLPPVTDQDGNLPPSGPSDASSGEEGAEPLPPAGFDPMREPVPETPPDQPDDEEENEGDQQNLPAEQRTTPKPKKGKAGKPNARRAK